MFQHADSQAMLGLIIFCLAYVTKSPASKLLAEQMQTNTSYYSVVKLKLIIL